MTVSREETLLRTQCGECKALLACPLEWRRRPMVCPMCGRQAPLVYVPPEAAGTKAKPVHELPLAKKPFLARKFWGKLSMRIVAVAIGFFIFMALQARCLVHSAEFMTKTAMDTVRHSLGMVPLPGRWCSNCETRIQTWESLKGHKGSKTDA